MSEYDRLLSSHNVMAKDRKEFVEKLSDILTISEAAVLVAKIHEKTTSLGKSKRFGLYPIENWDLFRRTKRLEAAYWQADEVVFGNDLNDFNEFTDEEKKPLLMAFGFFAVGDGAIVNMLAYQMILLADSVEKQGFYVVQLNNERVHSETYGKMIYTLVPDKKKREEIFTAVERIQSIKKMNEYIEDLFTNPADPSKRKAYVCLAFTEFLLFVPLFCIVFWYRAYKKGKINSVIEANQTIAQDEASHGQNGCSNYLELPKNERYTNDQIHAMIEVVVELISNFADEVLPGVNLPELTPANVKQYIRFVADDVLERLGHSPKYNVTSPFIWMTFTNLIPKENFFEMNVTQYGRFNVEDAIKKVQELHSGVIEANANPYKKAVKF